MARSSARPPTYTDARRTESRPSWLYAVLAQGEGDRALTQHAPDGGQVVDADDRVRDGSCPDWCRRTAGPPSISRAARFGVVNGEEVHRPAEPAGEGLRTGGPLAGQHAARTRTPAGWRPRWPGPALRSDTARLAAVPSAPREPAPRMCSQPATDSSRTGDGPARTVRLPQIPTEVAGRTQRVGVVGTHHPVPAVEHGFVVVHGEGVVADQPVGGGRGCWRAIRVRGCSSPKFSSQAA